MTVQAALKHVWISNAAFARITGIKKVCMLCGQANTNADKTCPGQPTGKREADR